MVDCGCEPIEVDTTGQLRTLRIALALNATMFVAEVTAGIVARSSGLIADGLDMLADASAYTIAILAIGRAAAFKARSATASGLLLLVLGFGVLLDVGRRIISGEAPDGVMMVAVASLAVAVNASVLRMLGKHRTEGIHLNVTWIFTRVDVIANIAVVVAGIAVLATGFRFIDLAVGAGIGLYVIKEATDILRKAGEARRSASQGLSPMHSLSRNKH